MRSFLLGLAAYLCVAFACFAAVVGAWRLALPLCALALVLNYLRPAVRA